MTERVTGIKNLLEIVRELPQIQELRHLLDASQKVCIEGLTIAVKSTLTAVLQATLDCPILLITHNYEQAERLYDDMTALGTASSAVLLVPPADSMIYQEGDSDLDVIGKRLSALVCLQDARPAVVIAPIASVLQRTLPPEVLASHRLRIEKSGELDLEECKRRLVELGYERTDMVERQGEFSQRGGIIDIFLSTEEMPLRIELFGDFVESIRTFNVETQRSVDHKDVAEIAPARELVLTPERVETAAEELTRLLDAETPKIESEVNVETANKLRDKIEDDIARLRNLAYFDGMEYYFPIVYPEAISLLDYLPANALVIIDEPHLVKSNWEQLHDELLESLHARIARGETLPLPTDHVVSFDEAISKLKGHGRLMLFSALPRHTTWLEVDRHITISSAEMDSFGGQIEMLAEQIKTWLANHCKVLIVTNQSHRVVEILNEYGLPAGLLPNTEKCDSPGIYVTDGILRGGFKLPEAQLMVVTDAEMFGLRRLIRPRKSFRAGLTISSLLELKEGDYVVHIHHGIGRYRGLTKLSGPGGERDYLLIEYAGSDKLYVPVDQIDRVQKYIGVEGQEPTIHKLGGSEWARTTKRVKQATQEMAKELLELYAVRQTAEGYSYSPDTPWQQELESSFEYEETPDQLEAIQEIKQDLESPKPMDRLLCGDVGYGKTEVAIRAVFKVVTDGKQAAVLTPTTVLAQQHFNTFTQRLAAYPIKIEMLSRFKTRSEQKKIIEGLRTGEVDIVIGTHRLLSKDIEFRDLGLLVIDEEHRFGVAHKERLKQLRKTVDVLTLTATPIPRTLHMSLAGIRDMSLINDPPEGRIPIKTYVREYDDNLVRDAILRELDRNGQVYFVHNRVENIEHIANHLRNLVPYARIEVAHGQMDEDALEKVMLDFYEYRFDVLVCTTIIESGLDIPNVNTIIINDADKMGLAQLYQLRGRVGRSNRQAYAYLLYKPHKFITEAAEKRLQAIKEFSDLGSGFKIALRDLEIRGAGNLLGPEQHGHMAAVGFDMYCQLLSEAIQELKGEVPERFELPPVDLPMDAYIPTTYIPNENLRLSFYKKMTAVREEKDVDQLAEEFRDRFGELPKPVANSLEILKLRLKAAKAGIAAITTDRRQVIIKFGTGIRLAPDTAANLKNKYPGTIFLTDKVLVHSGTPRLAKFIGYILDDLPAAFEDSKEYFFAKL
jgi:transcription-repair coupling factor (superfamily II helicase)